MGPPCSRYGWDLDEDGGLVLLRMPPSVRHTLSSQQHENSKTDVASQLDLWSTPLLPTIPTSTATLTNLPHDVHHLIISLLAPIDRTCLALTSKPLLRAVLAVPRLRVTTWTPFTDIHTAKYYTWHPAPLAPACIMPEWFPLIPRLAHGWLDPVRWRYCWRCHRNLPRAPAYWTAALCEPASSSTSPLSTPTKSQILKPIPPRYSVKVDLDEPSWTQLSRREKRQHLVTQWCAGAGEDSSYLYCDACRARHGLFKSETPSSTTTTSPFSSSTTTTTTICTPPPQAPVECPLCLWHGLTVSWQPPRGPSKLRKRAEQVAGSVVFAGEIGYAIVTFVGTQGCKAVRSKLGACCGLRRNP